MVFIGWGGGLVALLDRVVGMDTKIWLFPFFEREIDSVVGSVKAS